METEEREFAEALEQALGEKCKEPIACKFNQRLLSSSL
jgi:hypothetical protein